MTTTKQQWKGGRAVDCFGFENRRSFTATEGSNPSLSDHVKNANFVRSHHTKNPLCPYEVIREK